MSDTNPNQISVDLLASTSVNPWVIYDSSSRLQMLGSHLSQALVIKGREPRRNQTLAEREFGKATFNIKFPCNAEILAIIDKHHRRMGRDSSVDDNPMTVIIYENLNNREIGVLEVPTFHCLHQHFGFKYDKRAPYRKLHVGGTVAEGTIIADSPAVDEHGDYSMGLEANIAFMTIPGVTEDGVVISRSLSKRLETNGFESRSATWGKQWFPLNLYGTVDEYKPYPDIGQRIREDGLLFALRKYDPLMAPVEMTPAALMVPDYTFDKLIHGKPNAKVIDISVRSGSKGQAPSTPVGMDLQTQHYFDLELSFHERLIAAYHDIKRKRGNNVRISPQLHQMIFTSLMFRPHKDKQRATHIYQRTPMDDWRVEVTFEYDIPPTDGFKLTDLHGGKGVN